jgi:MOSC domain-containing protein YiiM
MATVVAVCASPQHAFSKARQPQIQLVKGSGVQGDAHAGATVKHRSRVARDPTQPNLRQVHLLQVEMLAALARLGHDVCPGDIGENITTCGIDLLALPQGTILRFGSGGAVRITGLRNPCGQLDAFQPGLRAALLGRTNAGELVRKAGVMAVVHAEGVVSESDAITVELPPMPYLTLRPV